MYTKNTVTTTSQFFVTIFFFFEGGENLNVFLNFEKYQIFHKNNIKMFQLPHF